MRCMEAGISMATAVPGGNPGSGTRPVSCGLRAGTHELACGMHVHFSSLFLCNADV